MTTKIADNTYSGPITALLGPDLDVDSGTIAPTHLIHRVNGSLNLFSITPPPPLSAAGKAGFFIVIPTTVWPWQTVGGVNPNIAVSGSTVIGIPVLFVWSEANALWYPLSGFTLSSGTIAFPGNGLVESLGGNLTLEVPFNTFIVMSPTSIVIAVGNPSPQFQFLYGGFIPNLTSAAPVSIGNSDAPFDQADFVRYLGHGTPLVAGNFLLSAGWGNTASVVVIEGDDSQFIIEITSAGAGQAPDPTATLLFQDGPWGALSTLTAPIAQAKLVSINGTPVTTATDVPLSEATTSGRLILTFGDTPTPGDVYRISCIVSGYDAATIPDAPNVAPVAVQTPPATGKTVMPLGDSITLGTPDPPAGGYRTFLWEYFQEYGRVINFVGTLQNGPPELGNTHHNGFSGANIATIQAIIIGLLAADPNPDAILLHIGTNDLGTGFAAALVQLGTLLDTIIANTAATQIFLAQIVPQAGADDTNFVIPYNAGIPSVIAGTTAPGRITLVDIYDAVNYATDIADTLHPNARGYQKMCVMWWNALAAFFP
jgi:lysophospholipase L1-like esterase